MTAIITAELSIMGLCAMLGYMVGYTVGYRRGIRWHRDLVEKNPFYSPNG